MYRGQSVRSSVFYMWVVNVHAFVILFAFTKVHVWCRQVRSADDNHPNFWAILRCAIFSSFGLVPKTQQPIVAGRATHRKQLSRSRKEWEEGRQTQCTFAKKSEENLKGVAFTHSSSSNRNCSSGNCRSHKRKRFF